MFYILRVHLDWPTLLPLSALYPFFCLTYPSGIPFFLLKVYLLEFPLIKVSWTQNLSAFVFLKTNLFCLIVLRYFAGSQLYTGSICFLGELWRYSFVFLLISLLVDITERIPSFLWINNLNLKSRECDFYTILSQGRSSCKLAA